MKTQHHRLLLLLLCAGIVPATVGIVPAQATEASGDELIIEEAGQAQQLTLDEMQNDRAAQGENNVISTQSLAATTSGNTLNVAGNLMNGDIAMGDQFGGSGFGSYVMNTGNNSTLTAATAVTIQMGPTR